MKALYLLYGSLVTELLSDTRCILAFHNKRSENSSSVRRLQAVNTLALIALRLPAVAYAATYVAGYPGWHSLGEGACLLAYSLFLIRMIYHELVRLGKNILTKSQFGVPCLFAKANIDRYGMVVFASFVAIALGARLLDAEQLFSFIWKQGSS
jgi:hypothetical protein